MNSMAHSTLQILRYKGLSDSFLSGEPQGWYMTRSRTVSGRNKLYSAISLSCNSCSLPPVPPPTLTHYILLPVVSRPPDSILDFLAQPHSLSAHHYLAYFCDSKDWTIHLHNFPLIREGKKCESRLYGGVGCTMRVSRCKEHHCPAQTFRDVLCGKRECPEWMKKKGVWEKSGYQQCWPQDLRHACREGCRIRTGALKVKISL